MLLSIDWLHDSLETVKKNRYQYDISLKILSYEYLYGWTIDKIVSQVGLKNNYTFCGVFRRQALDRGAMQLGVNKIVTGHNADDWSPGLAADARLWHESWGLRVGDGGGHQLAACELVLVQHVEGREEDEGGEHATDLLQGVGDVRVGADEDRLADLAGDVPSDGEQLHPGEAREEGAGGGGNSRNFASHVYNHSMTVNNHLLGANYIPGYKARTTKRSGKPTHQAHLFVIPSVV